MCALRRSLYTGDGVRGGRDVGAKEIEKSDSQSKTLMIFSSLAIGSNRLLSFTTSIDTYIIL